MNSVSFQAVSGDANLDKRCQRLLGLIEATAGDKILDSGIKRVKRLENVFLTIGVPGTWFPRDDVATIYVYLTDACRF